MGWTRKLLIVIAIVLVGAVVVVALSPRPLPVETGVVDTGAMQVTVEATGKMRVRHRYVVAAHVSGQLGRVEMRPGDVVEEGKELASIRPISPPLLDARTKAEAQSRVLVAEAARAEAASVVERARIARDHAGRELQRTRKLVEGSVLADEALDNAQFAADSRARELVSAELARQPDGIVVHRPRREMAGPVPVERQGAPCLSGERGACAGGHAAVRDG
jgi:HlyD family secretion protein